MLGIAFPEHIFLFQKGEKSELNRHEQDYTKKRGKVNLIRGFLRENQIYDNGGIADR